MGQYSRRRNAERIYERARRELSRETSRKAKSRVNWDDLSGHELLTLRHEVLQELVKEGVKKAGSRKKLERQTNITKRAIKEILEEGRDTIAVKTLERLLDFLNEPYDSVNKDIIAIGGSRNPDAIKNPRLPFDFNTPQGATIIAAALKDGWIDTQHRFRYANLDERNKKRVKEAVRAVFGDIASPFIEKEGRGTAIIEFRSYAIGEALEKAGVLVGRKAFHPYRVPEFIREGSPEVKRAYLYQTLMDEGSWKPNYIGYSQSVSIEKKLTDKDREYIKNCIDFEEIALIGTRQYIAPITKDLEQKIKEENPHLWKVIKDSKPPNMEDENKMLEDLCGVKGNIKPREIYYTEKYGYRVCWVARIGGKENYDKVIKGIGLDKRGKHYD
ncbi:MAG: hypothetical protein QXO47_04210 [Thermoproteota archaeon]|nr:hypothetical protein [Candidatus Brockarchaeota archaeon]